MHCRKYSSGDKSSGHYKASNILLYLYLLQLTTQIKFDVVLIRSCIYIVVAAHGHLPNKVLFITWKDGNRVERWKYTAS